MSETQEDKKPEFSTKVTHRDEKTGLVVKQDPYILRVSGETGSNVKNRMWERPAGSGNLFDKQMNPIGRWESEEKVIRGKKVKVGKYNPDAKHIEWKAPETQDQKLAREHAEATAKNAALEKELASLKAEVEKKNKSATAQTTKNGQGA